MSVTRLLNTKEECVVLACGVDGVSGNRHFVSRNTLKVTAKRRRIYLRIYR